MKQPILQVQDEHGRHAFWASVERCNLLVEEGVAKPFGSKRKTHGIRLLQSLEALGLKTHSAGGRTLTAPVFHSQPTRKYRVAGSLLWQHKRPRCGVDPFTRVIQETLAS